MKTAISKTSKFIALAMMFLASFTAFTACSSDDGDDSNTVKIDGQETKVISMLVNQMEENTTISLTIASVDKKNPKVDNLTFSVPVKDYGKTIKYKDGNVLGTLFDNSVNLNKESQFMVTKSDDGVYKLTFQLSQTVGGKTTTVAGTYEGKPTTVDIPQAQ